jgi:protein gp37
MAEWNPWHGCRKYSAGCANCYVYRRDAKYELDASAVKKNTAFDLPVRRMRDGSYKLKGPETVFTCFTSDFFLDEADDWRAEAWRMMRERVDLNFFFITKRILRFYERLPQDWGSGYANVSIGVTCETQEKANERLPFFLGLPVRHKTIICEPMLEAVDFSPYLNKTIEQVVVGGESGDAARLMRCEWALSVREQCQNADVPFYFKQTGALFEKDRRVYRIPRKFQMVQARKSGLSWAERAVRAPLETPADC